MLIEKMYWELGQFLEVNQIFDKAEWVKSEL
jgi:hypothetical protein